MGVQDEYREKHDLQSGWKQQRPRLMAPQPLSEWPSDGLEHLGSCPICGASDRELLAGDLTDSIFNSAPGRWSLWRCLNCEIAYLDPRPTRDQIGLAYQSYYTHEVSGAEAHARISPLRRLRRGLVNDYANARYGAGRTPSIWPGRFLAAISSRVRAQVDYQFRYAPRRWRSGEARVLDVGCGNGAFLSLMTSAGWKAVGCDFDHVAVEVARESNSDVRLGGIEVFADAKASFDFITLSHVIEHVFDPYALLVSARTLLRPGGRIFIDTPNINSVGFRKFGRFWRGLEPPRHLQIFHWKALRGALEKAGFVGVVDRPHPSVASRIWVKSYRMMLGESPYDETVSMDPNLSARLPKLAAVPKARTEYVTMTGERPPE